jgi:uncharacterized protein (DUF849 family)
MADKLIINAAITGMVPTKRDNPFVPLSVEEIIAEARRVRAAGASIIHVHARDEQGRPTCDLATHQRIVDGVRTACPDLIISGSTSGRVFGTAEQRMVALETGVDLASLTLGSMNFPSGPSINAPEMIQRLARRMGERGIVPELECFDLGMVDYARDYLLPKKILGRPLYFNLLLGSLGTAAATAGNLATLVGALPPGATWAGAGIGRFQTEMNRRAIEMGGHIRIGLEDNLWFDPEKTVPATNVSLIERIVKIARAAGREPAAPREAREMIGLGPRVAAAGGRGP